jgi:thiol-disulfide isomerase/thioredoxin
MTARPCIGGREYTGGFPHKPAKRHLAARIPRSNATCVVRPRNNPRVPRVFIGMQRLFVCLLSTGLALVGCGGSVAAMPADAPEFTHSSSNEWLNTAPLKLSALRGSTVLIEFWTFDCYNCRNTLPWLKAIHDEYGPRGLKIVSVHTPELAQERDPANVRAAVKQLGITWPVMIDGDFSYWRAMNNRYWPAFFLVDAHGRIVLGAFGELHRGEKRGDAMEAAIRERLAP